jgi:glycosyltransferase involved in cell wall biosynthesis
MKLLCLTPWFPAYPGAQSGNFILDSLLALQAEGHALRTLVVQPWHPAWAGRLYADWGRPRLQPELFKGKVSSLDLLRYLSVPRNHCRTVSLWMGRRALERRLRILCTDSRPDIMLVHTEQLAIMARHFSSSAGIPMVVVMHGINTSPQLQTAQEKRRMQNMLKTAARVVLVGEPLRTYFIAMSPAAENRFRVVHNGFRVPAVQQQRPNGPWPPILRFISVSNLHEGKGVDLNLQAFALLLKEGRTNWRYTIVGDGQERESLVQQVQELGLEAFVEFKGAVDHDKVYPLLSEADVFVLPSWREAFGLAWLEAMACGLLTIAVEGQGPSAFITHDSTGMLVPPRDFHVLHACLRRVFDEPLQMQALAKAGQLHACTSFTWQNHARELGKVFHEAMAGEQ